MLKYRITPTQDVWEKMSWCYVEKCVAFENEDTQIIPFNLETSALELGYVAFHWRV